MNRTAALASGRRTVPAARRLALLWLLVALLWQGFSVQTHAHYRGEPAVGVGTARTLATVAVDGQKPAPVAPPCQLCEEKALFGAYLAAGPITLVAPTVVGYRPAAAALPAVIHAASSHAWRSRAPPSRLA